MMLHMFAMFQGMVQHDTAAVLTHQTYSLLTRYTLLHQQANESSQ